MSHGAIPTRAGFYGKLPSRGDFINRGLPPSFVAVWDQWLQESILAGRKQLGQRWPSLYTSAPLWRFALGPGVCGERPFIGVMMTSIDRVGRHFPFVLSRPLPVDIDVVHLLRGNSDWFERAERLARASLSDELVIDQFERQLVQLERLNSTSSLPLSTHTALSYPWHQANPAELGQLLPECLAQLLQRQPPPLALWWSKGTTTIEPRLLLSPGLPSPQQFVALIDGDWSRWGWVAKATAASTPKAPDASG